MSSAYTEQDLRETEKCFKLRSDGQITAEREDIAALLSRIRSEARAGMREACANAIGNFKFLCEQNERAYASAKRLFSQAIRDVPDLAADEAIERIKREAHESGIREGASNEALLQRMFNEDGPVKIELERIKREARLEGRLAEAEIYSPPDRVKRLRAERGQKETA